MHAGTTWDPPEIYLARFGWARYLDRRGQTCAAAGISTTIMRFNSRRTADGKGVRAERTEDGTGGIDLQMYRVQVQVQVQANGTKAHVSISCCTINFAKLVLEPLAMPLWRV
ncbi:hypothetical protein J3F84DRAFT_355601 [Trichoderma pleuroticola]